MFESSTAEQLEPMERKALSLYDDDLIRLSRILQRQQFHVTTASRWI